MIVQETPHADLRKVIDGLNLYKSLADKFDMHSNNADIQAGEAATLLALYVESKEPTLLKAVQFHRDIARAEVEEAAKYLAAADEVARRLNLEKSIKQAGLKRLKKTKSNRIYIGKRRGKGYATRHRRTRFSKKRYGI